MAAYEFYTLDTGSLRIATERANCADDYDATITARALLSAGGLAEVWAGLRRVTTLSEPRPFVRDTSPESGLRMAAQEVLSPSIEPAHGGDVRAAEPDQVRPTAYPPNSRQSSEATTKSASPPWKSLSADHSFSEWGRSVNWSAEPGRILPRGIEIQCLLFCVAVPSLCRRGLDGETPVGAMRPGSEVKQADRYSHHLGWWTNCRTSAMRSPGM